MNAGRLLCLVMALAGAAALPVMPTASGVAATLQQGADERLSRGESLALDGTAPPAPADRPSASSEARAPVSTQTQGPPLDAEAFHQRANERTERGDFQGALHDLDEALRLRPTWVDAYIARGNVRYILGSQSRDQSELQRAVEDYSWALQLDPASSLAYYYRAAARGTLRDWTGAVDDYTAALRIDPTMDAAHFYRARYRELLCDIPGAIADYELAAAASQAQGDEANYRRTMAAIESLRQQPPAWCTRG